MAYRVHNVQPGQRILAQTVNEQDSQIASNEQHITELTQQLDQKITEPTAAGQPGQVLGLDSSGNRSWLTTSASIQISVDAETLQIIT